MALLIAEDSRKYDAREYDSREYDRPGRDRPGRDRPKHRGKPEYDIPERLLARLWRQRAARQAWLRTAQGRRVRVLYPGRPGGGAGPDFREALLEVEGQGLVRGDVELHVQQRDWKSHGHSQDPNYNGVVLHAVLGVESGSTTLNNGMEAPVVSLAPLLEDAALEDTVLEGAAPAETAPKETVSAGTAPKETVSAGTAPAGEEESGEPKGEAGEEDGVPGFLWGLLHELGYARPRTPEEAAGLLDEAGDQRFQAKTLGYARLLEETGRDPEALEQSLFEALMEGLGYRGNEQGFLGLAQRAPWRRLVELSRGLDGEAAQSAVHGWLCLVSGLTGASGLTGVSGLAGASGLTKSTGPADAFGLTGGVARRGGLPRGLGPPLAPGDWRLSGLRPANHPLRRMAGAAAWVRRFGDSGLAVGLREACGSGSPSDLTKALQVDGPEGAGAPVGRGRARDIAVNVALPFLQAADGPGSDSPGCIETRHDQPGCVAPGHGGKYLDMYHRFGKLQENELTKEMSRRLLPAPWRSAADSARRQQGLLHLQRLLAGAS